MNRVRCPVDSHKIDDLAVGRVMAERINDVAAGVNTKRHQSYLELLARNIKGYDDVDPNDVYRDRELVPTALNAYAARNGCQIERGWFYRHPVYEFIGCQPDAIEPNMCGLTAHIRSSEETYEEAVDGAMNTNYMRASQASMAVTGLRYWIHLEYWEDPAQQRRRLAETLFKRNPMADDMLAKLAFFWTRAALL